MGKQVAAGGSDGLIHLWKAPDPGGSEMSPGKVLKGHEGSVNTLDTLANDPNHLISGGEDGTLRRWNIESGSASKRLKNGAPVVAVLAAKDGKHLASIGADGTARLWSVEELKQVAELRGGAAGGQNSGAIQRAIALAKREITYRTARVEAAQKRVAAANDRQKKALAAIPAIEKTLAEKQKAFDEAKRVHDAAALQTDDKKEKADQEFSKVEDEFKQAQGAKAADDDEVKLAAKDVDDSTAAVADAKAAVDQATERAKLREAAGTAKVSNEPDQPVRAIAFSADGSAIITAGENGVIRTWSGDRGSAIATVHDAKSSITSVAFAGGGRVVVCPAHASPILLSPASGWSLDQTIVGGESADAFADQVTSLDFSPDGKLLATGGGVPSRSGEIRLIDLTSGAIRPLFDDLHSDTVLCVRFNPDGTHLATASADRFVRILDLASGKAVHSLEGHSGHVLGVGWSHDGHTLASAGADNALRFWDAETGDRGKVVQGFDKEVTGVCYVGDEDQVVAAAGDGKVRLVRENGSDIRTFPGPTDFVYGVAASADGATIVAGGNDGVLRAWDANSGNATRTFAPPERK